MLQDSVTPTGVTSADYDMGHYFSIGTAGGVGGAEPCALRRKTCTPDPTGVQFPDRHETQNSCGAWAGYVCPDDVKAVCLVACSVCDPSPSWKHKANGATASTKPVGDSFDTEYVPH